MRTRTRATVVAGLACALAVGACARLRGGFACTEGDQCGATGRCEPDGYCSFPDALCPSGWRYGDWAGALSRVCVGEEPPDGGPADAKADGAADAAKDAGDAAPPDAPDGPAPDGPTDAAQSDAPQDAQTDVQTDSAVCNPPWWDAAWSKRRQLTITNNATSTLPLNFQLGSPLDVEALIGGGTWDQIRVVRRTGVWTQLTRVIDSTGTHAEWVWFRLVATLGAGASDTSYWIYYGNSSADQPPNDPAQVFDFHDTFSSALDTRWQTKNSPTVNGAAEVVLDYDDHIGTTQTWGPGYATDVRLRITPVSQRFWLGWHVVAGGFPDVDPWILWITRQDGELWPEFTTDGANIWTGTHRTIDTNYHYYGIDRFADRIVYRRENAVVDNHAISSFTTSLPVRVTNETVSGTVYVDFVRVRQAVYPLPTTTLGAEETCP